MASGPITSWQMDAATMEMVTDFDFPGLQNHTSKLCSPWGCRVEHNWTATWSQGHSVHSNFSCLTTASEAKGQHESCFRRVSELLYYSGTPLEELHNICSQGPLSSWTPRGSCPLVRADFSGKLANLNLQDPLRSSSYCCICDCIAFTSERIPQVTRTSNSIRAGSTPIQSAFLLSQAGLLLPYSWGIYSFLSVQMPGFLVLSVPTPYLSS